MCKNVISSIGKGITRATDVGKTNFLAPIAAVALNAVAPGLGAALGGALDIGTTAGSALVGGLTGATTSAITGSNPLTATLEGAGGSLANSAFQGLGGLNGIGQSISDAADSVSTVPNSIVDSIGSSLGDAQNSFANSDLGNALGVTNTGGGPGTLEPGTSLNSAVQGATGVGAPVPDASASGFTGGGGMSFGTPGAASSVYDPATTTAALDNTSSSLTPGNVMSADNYAAANGSLPASAGATSASGTAAWSPYSNSTSYLNGAGGAGSSAAAPSSPLSLSGLASGIQRNPIAAGLTILQAIQSSKPNTNQQIYAQQQAANAAQNALFQKATTSAPGVYNYTSMTPQDYANYAYGTGNKQQVSFTGNSNAPALADGGDVPDMSDDPIMGGTGGIDPSIMQAIMGGGSSAPTATATASTPSTIRPPSAPLSLSGITSGVQRNPIAGLLTILQAIQSSKPNSNQQIYAQQQAANAAQNQLFSNATHSAPGTYNQTPMTAADYANYAYGNGPRQMVNFQGNSAAGGFADGGQVPSDSSAYLSNALYDNILVPPSGVPQPSASSIPMMAGGGQAIDTNLTSAQQTGLNAAGLNADTLMQNIVQNAVKPNLYTVQPVTNTASNTSTDTSGTGMAKGGIAPQGKQGLMQALAAPAAQTPPQGAPTAQQMPTGQLFGGPGGGQSDNINAGSAIVSPGEFVHRAAVTAAAGDGNPEEGAKRLNEMGENLLKDYGAKLVKSGGKNPPKNKNIQKFMPKSKRKSAPKANTKPPVE